MRGAATAWRRARGALFVFALGVALLAGILVAAPAHSQVQSRTLGSTLAAAPNLDLSSRLGLPAGSECAVRPNIADLLFGGFIFTGTPTCTWWPAPGTAANTYVPLGRGTITRARVRSGPNPAPLRIAVLSSGSGLCCTAQVSSQVFQPAPNAVTQVTVNLPVAAGLDRNRAGSQFTDFVGVTAVGPGSLPVADTGNRALGSDPAAAYLHPELTNNNSNTDVGYGPGYEVLLQVDWCGVPGVALNERAAPRVPHQRAVACPGFSPRVRLVSARAPVAANRARLRVACAVAACRGAIELRSRNRGGALLGRATPINLPAGARRVVAVRLTPAGVRALAGRRALPVRAVVRIAGVATALNATLRR
jgi:hypothetical protein